MFSIGNGLKKLALAGIATAGLLATATTANADWHRWHHHHHNYNNGFGNDGYRSFCNSDNPHYDRGRCLSFRAHHPGVVSPLAFCNSGSPDYDARRCWRYKHR